jgi:uncharacterized membrane protein
MPSLELPRSRVRSAALLLLAIFFVFAGVNHFANPDFYVAIMPPYLPAHLELVYLSGVFEVIGGLAALAPATRALAGWGLVLLLMAVYPANIHMAMHPEQFPDVPVWGLYARLPLQIVFVAWAWWATRPDAPAAAGT